MKDTLFKQIDIPFDFRHTCWFCGEPSQDFINFPASVHLIPKLEHEPIAIPACDECSRITFPNDIRCAWSLRDHIKNILIVRYAKHLGIGENWTEQELVDTEFSGSSLGGFGRSAWAMFEIAKTRVSFSGWSLSVDEVPLVNYDETSGFTFDGTKYLSLSSCIDYYEKATGIDKELLTKLVDIVKPERFGYALKISKLNKGLSHSERLDILEEIALQETEQEEIDNDAQFRQRYIDVSIEDVMIEGCVAPAFSIQWALSKGVRNLDHLCAFEDDYFDEFEYLGGPAAFMTYNGLQLYLEARENKRWVEDNDPNRALWEQ
ncbi:hypothetical protein [Vibrio alfacsensis]|uniref:hypothetical protein n=1 Tax=Vibrio TaxID=662 RepID=UPI004068D457